MTASQQFMTDDQRKSLALTYLKAFDNAGVTADGGSILDLFADDAQVFFPKWGVATGKEEIGRMFGDVGATITSILHDYADFNWVMTGTDTFACEGTSAGEHRRRALARRHVTRRTLGRRLRGARQPHPALLHLPRPRLRREGHGSLPVARCQRPGSVAADGLAYDRHCERRARISSRSAWYVLRIAADGKVVLITGAGTGIGRAAALAMLRDGARVALVGRRAELLRQTAADGSDESRALVLQADVTDADAVQAVFGHVTERWGRLDVLFNNAGMGAPAVPLEDLSLAQWRRSST